MSKRTKRFNRWMKGGAGILAAAAAVSSGMCAEASDPLLDALIRKGILTEQEAKDIQSETKTNTVSTSVSKWKLSDSIKSIGLFGDVRFRYEYRGVDNVPGASPNTYYRERFRYALRAGIRGDLFDNFNYGIRLETSANPRSPWVTMADDTGSASSGGIHQGTPSDKSSDFLNIGQVYLGWKPADWYEMTVGRMPMPLYTTPMMWDSDINPEGAFEKFKFSVGNVDLFADFGQFIYQDTNPDHAVPSSDTWLFAWQVGASAKITPRVTAKIAPVLYNYAGRGSGSLFTPYTGEGTPLGFNTNSAAFNQTGINDLLIVEVPMEIQFPIGPLQGRAFGDFAYNVNGDRRAEVAFARSGTLSHAYTGENKAYQVGFGIGNKGPVYGPTQGLVYGSTSKKNTWEARVYWQHVEQYALDPNLMDSDFFEGRANLQGIYAAVAYSFTDAIIGTIRYGHADRINDNLGTGGSNLDIPIINPIKNYNLVQLDLTWRF